MEIFRKIGKTTGFHRWILKDMLEKHLDKKRPEVEWISCGEPEKIRTQLK